MPNLEAEWMQTIKERDMAVKAIRKVLALIDNGGAAFGRIVKCTSADAAVATIELDDEEPEEVKRLREVLAHLGRKVQT